MVLFVITLGVILWLFIGKSPTIEQALLLLILTLVVKNSTDLRELKQRTMNNEAKFNALAQDFKEHIKHQ